MQGVVDKVSRGYNLVVMGDFNAWVGKSVEVWKSVTCKHGEDVV